MIGKTMEMIQDHTLITSFFCQTFMGKLPLIPILGGHFYCSDNYRTERTGYDANLMIYTISGKGKIRYRNQEKELLPGTAVVFDCREYQYYATEEGNIWNFVWIHFDGGGFPIFDQMLNQDGIQVLWPSEDKIMKWFEQLEFLSTKPCMDSDVESSEILYQLLCELLKSKNRNTSHAVYTAKESIELAAMYMREHYQEEISIEKISERYHVSKYYFIRLFKEQYGQTPHEYLVNIRVSNSKKLLVTTSLSMEKIANAVGFKDSNTYIKVFKKKVNQTPAKFRKSFCFLPMQV